MLVTFLKMYVKGPASLPIGIGLQHCQKKVAVGLRATRGQCVHMVLLPRFCED